MIFQLTTYGQTRDEALSTMTKALDSYVIRGKYLVWNNNSSKLLPCMHNSAEELPQGKHTSSTCSVVYQLTCCTLLPEFLLPVSHMHLLSFYNLGLINNVSLLRDVVTHPYFITGDITTKFFEEHYPDGFKGMILLLVSNLSGFAIASLYYDCICIRYKYQFYLALYVSRLFLTMQVYETLLVAKHYGLHATITRYC